MEYDFRCCDNPVFTNVSDGYERSVHCVNCQASFQEPVEQDEVVILEVRFDRAERKVSITLKMVA